MIIGKLKNLDAYKGLGENLDTAIEYILKTDLLSLSNGRTDIYEDKIFLNKFSYNCTTEENGFFEGHEKYLDIHIVLNGQELLGYSDKSDVTAVSEYDIVNDFTEYKGVINTYCKCTPSDFIILFPNDIHMPKISIDNSNFDNQTVDKVVLKVLMS